MITGVSRILNCKKAGIVVAAWAMPGVLVAGCSATEAQSQPEISNAAMCLDALALPVTSAVELLLDTERLPEIRRQAFAILDVTSPDAEVTAAAHDVALKSVAVIDAAESVVAESGDALGLLGSGLESLSALVGPVDDAIAAEAALAEVCLRVVGPLDAPSGSPSSRASTSNVTWL